MIWKTKMGFIKRSAHKIAVAVLCCNHFLIQDPVIFIHMFYIHWASA